MTANDKAREILAAIRKASADREALLEAAETGLHYGEHANHCYKTNSHPCSCGWDYDRPVIESAIAKAKEKVNETG